MGFSRKTPQMMTMMRLLPGSYFSSPRIRRATVRPRTLLFMGVFGLLFAACEAGLFGGRALAALKTEPSDANITVVKYGKWGNPNIYHLYHDEEKLYFVYPQSDSTRASSGNRYYGEDWLKADIVEVNHTMYQVQEGGLSYIKLKLRVSGKTRRLDFPVTGTKEC